MSLSKVLRVLMVLPVLMVPGAAQEKAPEKPEKKDDKERREEVGRQRAARANDEARVRDVRRHVGQRRREPGREADRVRSARRSLRHADRWYRRAARHTADERSGLRHAAAVQPRRQADRLLERSRRAVEHLDDRRGREGPEAGLEGSTLVRQQPHLVARRSVHLRAASLRERAIARRGRDLDVSLERRRRAAGDREGELAEGRGRAGGLTGRPLPLLQQGRHARSELRIQQGPLRRHLRDRSPRPDDRQGEHSGVAPGRIGRAAALSRREAARVRPARGHEERAVRSRTRNRPGMAGVRSPRQGPAGGMGDSRRVRAVRVDTGQPGESSSGARERFGKST